ncbi:LppX_LprAFG lipoprotein [Mycobacteroides abscessus]|uniref:LppX_LprAFG lipoprotein n=1 Tax=Mycobacteroides abscessus TaxID=36809 RepID=UPI0005DC1108|nr:LppX_LprAFG lipoprotein [Mycobacteroides abscessus]CPW92618.1 LprG protein [Mycobacteroides abscessus]SKF41354.1 LprG protein [Mycobacteroides abscessus subsp. bolletii]SKH18655.1 LprG protein [Mycobacteroides abscessus subsp. bolletii]
MAQSPVPSTVTEPDGVSRGADATLLMNDAVSAARATPSARLLFSSTNVADLLAKAYAADVTVTPAIAARGNATLKINGDYTQAQFRTGEGTLWVQGSDGAFVKVGRARGTLDPAALLDPARGIAGLLAAVDSPVIEEPHAFAGSDAAIKVTGTLPSPSASALIPKSSLGDAKELPAALWLAPQSPHQLMQLTIAVGDGSLALRVEKGEPFTIPVQ